MAKSSRSSARKANNRVLKAKVFGPREAERQQRLSDQLLKLANAPKEDDGVMKVDSAESAESADEKGAETSKIQSENVDGEQDSMDVDASNRTATSSSKRSVNKRRLLSKSKIEKRKKPRNSLVFKLRGGRSGRK